MDKKEPDQIIIKDTLTNVKKAGSYLMSKWAIIAACGFICAALSLGYIMLQKPLYTAECTFVLEEKGKAGMGLGQYSALASLAGIEVGGSGLFEGDNIFELYKSRLMIKKTLLSRAAVSGASPLLIDRYLEVSNMRRAWSDNPKLKDLRFDIPKEQYTIRHDSIIKVVVKQINKDLLTVDKRDKKLGIISVKFKSEDQQFAKLFTDQLVQNVNNFYIQTRTKGTLTNVQLLQRQTDSIKRILNSSIGATASALDATPNPNPNMQVLRVPSQRRYIDVQASSAIYSEVLKNLEIAKATLQRETPLIQVIDEPLLPLDSDAVSKSSAVLTGGSIGVLLSCMGLLISKLIKRL